MEIKIKDSAEVITFNDMGIGECFIFAAGRENPHIILRIGDDDKSYMNIESGNIFSNKLNTPEMKAKVIRLGIESITFRKIT